MPRISILLTCYNHLRYLPACVEGIRAQTMRDYEIIAIDDGSTDGSREWLAAQHDIPDPIFNAHNLGTYASLNVALARASGEFIAVLNDDDLWAPTKLERQLEWFERFPKVGLVHTDGTFIDGDGKPFEGEPLGFSFPKTETGNLLLGLVYANKIIASAALVRRECFDRLGGFNEAYFGSGDWEMWLRVAEAYDVGFVPERLTFYRVHGGNASHKLDRIWQDDDRLREWIRSREAAYRSLGLQPEALDAAMAHNDACLGTVKTLNGKPQAGREAYARAISRRPLRVKSYLRWLTTFLPRPLVRRLL